MKNIFVFFTALILFSGCSKPLPCETFSTGSLKVVSIQLDPFYTYVNDEYIGISEPATITEFGNIPTGIKTVDFINVNDWNDAYFANVNFYTCQESAVQL